GQTGAKIADRDLAGFASCRNGHFEVSVHRYFLAGWTAGVETGRDPIGCNATFTCARETPQLR
ncbi:MAG: hypothetical protein ACREQ9_20840, partial [Candidatus Binatia bacterium]